MRQQQDNIFSELFQDDEIKIQKIVQEYRNTYKKIDALLQKYPELIKAAHHDLQTLCKLDPTRQRKPGFTIDAQPYSFPKVKHYKTFADSTEKKPSTTLYYVMLIMHSRPKLGKPSINTSLCK